MHMISRADYLQERKSGENMADLMSAQVILSAIRRNKERVAPAEEDSGVITGYRMAHDHIMEIIIRCIPTVDAVEVVRCKDCKYCGRGTDEDGKPFLKCLEWAYGGKKPNDFCSYGERKDNGNS